MHQQILEKIRHLKLQSGKYRAFSSVLDTAPVHTYVIWVGLTWDDYALRTRVSNGTEQNGTRSVPRRTHNGFSRNGTRNATPVPSESGAPFLFIFQNSRFIFYINISLFFKFHFKQISKWIEIRYFEISLLKKYSRKWNLKFVF